MDISDCICLVAIGFIEASDPYNCTKLPSEREYMSSFLDNTARFIGKRTEIAVRSYIQQVAPGRYKLASGSLSGHEALLVTEEILKSNKLSSYEEVPYLLWRFVRYKHLLEKKRESDRRVSTDA